MPDSQVFISVVIPIYNEEENIPELHERLTPILEKLCSDAGQSRDNYEIMMVDDGSRDRSWELIRDLHRRDGRVRGITFARNFGHH
ncbi:MAG TPA: glycosyltransferase, partial [Thermodesulfovibrionales bacterium]|nr:glycosyltransferase [Thermodesulfovibrionales bacterium]